MDLIQVKNLSFSYPTKKDTLKDINFNIKEGTFNCIVGENGSGKSTLLKCILGLNRVSTGEIIKENNIGYLPQKSEIQANFPASIEEVVLSGTISNNIRSIFYKKALFGTEMIPKQYNTPLRHRKLVGLPMENWPLLGI